MNTLQHDWTRALIGGIIIGIAVSLMLLWNGRVTGISGIISEALNRTKGELAWRVLFIIGLFIGGLSLKFINPYFDKIFFNKSSITQAKILSATITEGAIYNNPWITIIAGLLVGFGTVLGSGCTSGHGICGVSRLSPRSLVATLNFIIAGALIVFLLRTIGLIL
jgi:uncharacterized membrane protein YedE/YeeE